MVPSGLHEAYVKPGEAPGMRILFESDGIFVKKTLASLPNMLQRAFVRLQPAGQLPVEGRRRRT